MTGRLTWLESDGVIPGRFARPARRFMQLEAASGLVLLAAAAVALLWANLTFLAGGLGDRGQRREVSVACR